MFRRPIPAALVIVVVLLASAVPLFAQQENITLQSLLSRINGLSTVQQNILERVAKLELVQTELAKQQFIFVTDVEISPWENVVTNGNVNVRAGPGTEHKILGTVEKGSRLPLLQQDLTATWWQVDYAGQLGWIHRFYLDILDSEDRVSPDKEVLSTSTETPTSTEVSTASSLTEREQTYALIRKDLIVQGHLENEIQDEMLDVMSHAYFGLANEVATRCGLSLESLLTLIDKKAQLLDETEIPQTFEVLPRFFLLAGLRQYVDEGITCEELVEVTITLIISNPELYLVEPNP